MHIASYSHLSLVYFASNRILIPILTDNILPSNYFVILFRNWGIQIVPENQVFIVQRKGVYLKQLPCGIHLTIPCVDKIAHIHCLIEKKYFIVWQNDLTSDDKFFNFNTEFRYRQN